MKISTNFNLQEFIQSNTADIKKIDNTPNKEVINNITRLVTTILQPVRDIYNKSITIKSGFRCKALNDIVKGSKTSDHLTGSAADITTGSKGENKKLFEIIVNYLKDNKIQFNQLINENNYSWIHIAVKERDNKNQILNL